MRPKAFFVAATCCLASACGCIADRHHHEWTGPIERLDDVNFEPEIVGVLRRQADAWNAGDVAGYMEPYWHSPELTFSAGGKVTRGFESTSNYFRTAYPDRAAMGKLTFTDLEITPLCSDAVMVLGRWRLEATPPKSGAFTLVMRRIDGSWVIIHDHTSRDAS